MMLDYVFRMYFYDVDDECWLSIFQLSRPTCRVNSSCAMIFVSGRMLYQQTTTSLTSALMILSVCHRSRRLLPTVTLRFRQFGPGIVNADSCDGVLESILSRLDYCNSTLASCRLKLTVISAVGAEFPHEVDLWTQIT